MMNGCHGDSPVIFHLLKTQERSVRAAESWAGRGGASASQPAAGQTPGHRAGGRVGDAAWMR